MIKCRNHKLGVWVMKEPYVINYKDYETQKEKVQMMIQIEEVKDQISKINLANPI